MVTCDDIALQKYLLALIQLQPAPFPTADMLRFPIYHLSAVSIFHVWYRHRCFIDIAQESWSTNSELIGICSTEVIIHSQIVIERS